MVLYLALLILLNTIGASAVKHTLAFRCTVVSKGINDPEFTAYGLLDGEKFMFYNSSNGEIVTYKAWMKLLSTEPFYWNTLTDDVKKHQKWLINTVFKLMKNFNQTEGVHTFQWMYGCELDVNNITRGYDRYVYDGEDLMILNLTTETWIAANNKAVKFIMVSDPNGERAKYWTDFLQRNCVDHLQKILSNATETQERKDGGSNALIIGVVAGLVVLIAVITAVVLFWKKKNSDDEHRHRVQQNGYELNPLTTEHRGVETQRDVHSEV